MGRPESREETPKEGIATEVAGPVYARREMSKLRLLKFRAGDYLKPAMTIGHGSTKP
jgi:hypothetical protein